MGVRSTIRLELPHEPGEWVELRKLSARQIRTVKAAGVQAVPLNEDDKDEAESVAMIEAYCLEAIVAWSYQDEDGQLPVTPENVGDLDMETQGFLFSAGLKGQREAGEEKKSASHRSRARAGG